MDFSKEQRLVVWVLVGLSLAAIGVGVARRQFTRPGKVEFVHAGGGSQAVPGEEVPQIPQRPFRSGTETDRAGQILVHVAGHVKKPGLYAFRPGDRIATALKAAGGASGDADLDAINLAAKVEDGMQIYVPSKKESRSAASPRAFRAITKSATPGPLGARITPEMWQQAGQTTKLSVPGQGTVNINTAGPAELQRLPGVGPSTAQKIIDHRATNGPFRAPEELMDVKGIGPKKFEKMRPFVRI